MIILSDDIIFRKAVIHLLNVELGKFAPAQDLFMMQPDVIELVRKQVSGLADMEQTNRIPCIKLERMSRKDIHRTMQRSSVKRSVIKIRREQSIITRSRNV